MSQQAFLVKTQVFEGPLELLLHLVEKRKLFINDISLSQVADDYVSHIQDRGNYPIGDVASFVLVASVLVLIKSRSLLPSIELTDEEEGSMEDLEKRLKIYKRMRELAGHVQESFGKNIIFPRIHVSKQIKPVFTPDESMNVSSVHEAVLSCIKKVPRPEKKEERTVRNVVSIEEMIDRLTERVTQGLAKSFSEFTGEASKGEKVTVVVSFLALLELVKQGTLVVRQDAVFSDIHLESLANRTESA